MRQLTRVWKTTRELPLLPLIGTVGCLLFILLAAVGPFLTPYDPIANSLSDRLQPSSWQHPMGTDHFGRDILARVIYGARNLLIVTGLSTIISVSLGAGIGLWVGYMGGWIDELVMRVFDALLALPAMLLSLLLVGGLGASRVTILLAIIVLYVPIVARVVRGIVLDLKTRPYVEAALTGGASLPRILFRELFPGVLPALTVEAALRFSYAIFLVASLGYLGIGVTRPEPDWGLMVFEARDWYALAPWVVFWPASAIVTLVVCVNLMSDGLRKVFRTG